MNEYDYWGSKITKDTAVVPTREIVSGINQAKRAFRSKKNMFISREIRARRGKLIRHILVYLTG